MGRQSGPTGKKATGAIGHDVKKIIHDSQHGFTKDRSCLTNLLSLYTKIIEAVDRDENYDILYLDFSKAFEKVPHHRLLHKIQAHGVDGKVLNWIRAWLSGRKQRVQINGKKI